MFGYEYLEKFLHEEGFRINEESSFFSFKYQGKNYVAFKNESPYLQLVMMCDTSQHPKSKLLEVCNKLNSDKFVVKFIVNGDDVWCSYEFIPTQKTSGEDFDTILMLLDNSLAELFKALS